MLFLLDTNTCIALMRNHPTTVLHMARQNPMDCAVSTISAYELFTGIAKCSDPRREGPKVAKLLQSVHKLPFNLSAANQAGKIRADLEARGSMIGPYDVLLAGHALSQGLVLVTANAGEFSRVAGLTLEDWSK
jgi:tRNA(fMet)-specific endonuclease VapC